MDFDKEMSKLHQRVSSQEGVVGWWVQVLHLVGVASPRDLPYVLGFLPSEK